MRAIFADKNIPRILLTKTLTPLWPGFVWTPLSSARAAQLPDPPLPGPRWLRMKNQACGICASDLSLLFAQADPSVMPAALPGLYRFWLGHEVISVVTEAGPGVTRFRIGDRVVMDTYFAGATCATLEIEPVCRYCSEGLPQFCLNKSAPGPRGAGGGFGDSYVAHETALYRVPDSLSSDQAAMVEPLSIAHHAVLRHLPRPGEKVLVIGAGIIGLFTVMALRALALEAEISAVARHPHQQNMAEKLGARHILQGSSYAEVERVTGGRYFSAPLNRGVVTGGFDVIFDCVADEQTTNNALRWTRAGGTVVMVGSHLSPMPKVDLTPVWFHQVNLIGTYGHGMEHLPGGRKHTYDIIFDGFRDGRLDITGLITHRFPLRDYKEAIRVATSKGPEKAIKVLFEVD
ncbi:MAG: zinc-dependent alcohol dehydrogenase [Bacteroidota bacterium]